MIILKFMSLVVAIWFTIVNFGLIHHKQDVPAINIILQSLSIVTFLFIQFNLFQ